MSYEPNEYTVNFLKEVNDYRKAMWKKHGYTHKENPDPVVIGSVGRKYIKLTCGLSAWGFISRVDGVLKGSPIKKGDLLKAAGYNTPAKHSRGNIIDGTASYGEHGPSYLK